MNLRRFATTRALKRVGRALFIAVALYALLGFVVIPRVARSVLETKLTALVHRRTAIRKISLNPFTLEVTVDGFAVQDRDGGPFVSFDQLYLDFQALSLFKGGVILRDIVLRAPAITVVRETATTYSFSDLLEQFSTPPDPNAKPTRYSLNNIRLIDGRLDVVDKPKAATHTVRDLQIAVPFLSTLPYDLESYVQPSFSAVVNGTPFALKGRTKPFSETRETAFDIDFTALSIPTYMEYVPVELRFTVPAGKVDAQVALSFRQQEGLPPALSVSGHVAVRDLAAHDLAGKPFLTLGLLDVTLAPSDVFGGKASVSSLRLEKPELHVRRGADGKLDLAALAPDPGPAPDPVAAPTSAAPASAAPASAAPAPAAPAEAPFVVEIAETHLGDGVVHFADAPSGAPFETRLEGVTLDVHHFSTAPGAVAALDLRLRTEAGESVHDAGELTLTPLHTSGRVEVTGLSLKKYAPYYAPSVLVDVDEGKLDVATRFDLDLAGKTPRVVLTELGATLTDLRAHKRGEKRELLSIGSLEVKDTSVDLGKRALTVGEITGHKGHVQIERAAGGVLNLGTLAPPPARREAKPAAEEPEWTFLLTKLSLDEWSARVEDQVPERPVVLTVDPLALTVDTFSLARGSRFNVSIKARLNRTGSLTAAGSVVLDPLAASLKIDARAVDLLPLQPYFTDRVNLLLTSGNVSGNGELTLAATAGGNKVTYKGSAGIARLAAVDKKSSEDFLRWESFALGGLDVSTDPPSLTIGEVALTSFYSRLAINPDATLNLRGIMVPSADAPAADAAAPAGGPSMPVRVDTVTLQGGTIDFTDRLVKPNFSASLHEVGGRISGLSSREDSVADLDLRAKLEDYAPLEIAGKVNPLARELSVDLKVAFHDIDVSPLSPYAGKYAGYTISKGKLFLDLKYVIAKQKLEAQNSIFLDQLTLGDAVESRDATKLPVRLAIALLKDRKGEIHIDLPLTGSLSDPKFSVWGLVWSVVENLLLKAVTSPFALIGSLVGHGEELSYLEFDEGRAVIGPAGVEKLKSLSKALADRPALKLDVTGHADPTRDREGLRRVLFDRKVKSQKVKDLTAQGVPVAASVDEIKVEPAEYPRYLELAYKEETFPKPRNVLGMAKDLPAAEMEKLMLTHLTVKDDDLRLLAQDRAQAVKEQLGKAGVPIERIFVVEPKTVAPEPKDKLKNSRVDFLIK
jgi:hypothetical protein